MSTFFGQLVGFALIVFLVVRYAVPPVRGLMTARQNTVRQQLADAASAAERLTESTTAHNKAVEAAQSEAERVVEEAKVDAERISAQLQAQAEIEAERIKGQGSSQAELLRSQLSRQLRQELGLESVRQAGELVRSFVADAAQQSATVDRFLDELDEMAPAAAHVEYPLMAKMRSASRRAVVSLSDRFDAIAKDLDDQRAEQSGPRAGRGSQLACSRSRRYPLRHPGRRRRGAAGPFDRAAAGRAKSVTPHSMC